MDIKTIAENHKIRKAWVYEQIKKEKYEHFLSNKTGKLEISVEGYQMLCKDIEKLKLKKEKMFSTKENINFDIEKYENIIRNLTEKCEMLKSENKYLRNQNIELIALSASTSKNLDQEQQLHLKTLSKTELLLLEKREELEVRRKENAEKKSRRSIFRRFF